MLTLIIVRAAGGLQASNKHDVYVCPDTGQSYRPPYQTFPHEVPTRFNK